MGFSSIISMIHDLHVALCATQSQIIFCHHIFGLKLGVLEINTQGEGAEYMNSSLLN